jgi:hypothetical protein
VINQSRAKTGLKNVGVLGRRIYPLIGASAFSDVVFGNNGAYSAASGYDLCTGVGTPAVSNLIAALTTPTVVAPAPADPIKAGTRVRLEVEAPGNATYQWQLNGAPIRGATFSEYSIYRAGAADNGAYSVVVTTATGSTTMQAGTLQTTSDARIINLSAHAYVSPGDDSALTAGFVIGGTSSNTKTILVRGVGPSLGQFGIKDVLVAPKLTFFDSKSLPVASTTRWDVDPGMAALMSSVGAFSLTPNSRDTALVQKVLTNAYTMMVATSDSTSGTAIAEIYDASYKTEGARLANISARAVVKGTTKTLVAGFVVEGGPNGGDETVLIRAIGPALSDYGIKGTLSKPVLTVYDSNGAIYALNVGWEGGDYFGSTSVTAAVMDHAGAFALRPGSADSAVVLTLPPGAYTAEVSGFNETSGAALCEIYEVK